jgi:signal transduction histidine kinase
MAIYHAIRNAQDATPADGSVSVEVQPNGKKCAVSIVDTGLGMDEVFVRERLFKPFDSTKGTSGMGIGAYQIRETVRLAGGRMDVVSAPGQGTRLTMVLDMEA